MTASEGAERVRIEELTRRMNDNEHSTREALRLANESLLRLGGHESQCDLRYKSIADGLEKMSAGQTRIHSRVDSIFTRLLTWGGSLVGVLLAMLAYLLINGAPWAH